MERSANATTNRDSIISLRRLQTLTDCVFALALILLVVFIEKPPAGMKPTEASIKRYLFGQLDTIAAYVITFMNIAFYWFFNHNQSKHFRRSDNVHVWLTLAALMLVGLLPYSNALTVAFGQSLLVQLFYSAIIFAVGLILCIDWLYATRKDRLVERALGQGTVEELIVECLVQPVAAILSFGGALIGTFWWQLPFICAPVAIIAISALWRRRRMRRLGAE
jgi:uncharacterized membrane protein